MTFICLNTSAKEASTEERVFDVESIEAIEFIRGEGDITPSWGYLHVQYIKCTLLEGIYMHIYLLAQDKLIIHVAYSNISSIHRS